jgi:medium-chain acyl-[acyl-carrier-protein] hydrolase
VLPRHPQLHALPAAEFMEEMRTLNGTPAEVLESREIMDALFPVLRADFEMCETYRYLPETAPCPLHVLGGADDPNITRDDLEAWAAETSGTFDLRIFPGDHFYLQSSPAAPLAAVRAYSNTS